MHDFRNTIQHKGLTPDAHTTNFYVNEAYNFVKRFLRDEINLNLASYLPYTYIKTMENIEQDKTSLPEEIRQILLESERLLSSGAHEMAVIAAFTGLEIALRKKTKVQTPSPLVNLIRQLVDSGKFKQIDWDILKRITHLRNRAAHTGGGISTTQAREALNELERLIYVLPNDI